VSGREVGLLADGQRAAGRYTLRLSGSGGAHPLAGGVYFARAAVRMAGRTEVRTARVVFFE
jgi:hypothetical protein